MARQTAGFYFRRGLRFFSLSQVYLSKVIVNYYITTENKFHIFVFTSL